MYIIKVFHLTYICLRLCTYFILVYFLHWVNAVVSLLVLVFYKINIITLVTALAFKLKQIFDCTSIRNTTYRIRSSEPIPSALNVGVLLLIQ